MTGAGSELTEGLTHYCRNLLIIGSSRDNLTADNQSFVSSVKCDIQLLSEKLKIDVTTSLFVRLEVD